MTVQYETVQYETVQTETDTKYVEKHPPQIIRLGLHFRSIFCFLTLYLLFSISLQHISTSISIIYINITYIYNKYLAMCR